MKKITPHHKRFLKHIAKNERFWNHFLAHNQYDILKYFVDLGYTHPIRDEYNEHEGRVLNSIASSWKRFKE